MAHAPRQPPPKPPVVQRTVPRCVRGRAHGFAGSASEGIAGDDEGGDRVAGTWLEEHLVRTGDYTDSTSAYRAALDLSRLPEPPTAVFAFSDRLAFGTLRAAHELELPVPSGLSIVGFDHLEATELVSPTITTVRRPLSTMGSTAAMMLLQLINGEKPPAMHIQLAAELVVRQSTGARRTGR
ncbi:substrate-binding domain-containing protein [Streptomyces sp. NPDC001508]|uniref:substrate-binding domain-containing protein n=1 Tax=Streptomyces sp. NPDC001508 TaxID=3154656 RepID=UPI00332529DB